MMRVYLNDTICKIKMLLLKGLVSCVAGPNGSNTSNIFYLTPTVLVCSFALGEVRNNFPIMQINNS